MSIDLKIEEDIHDISTRFGLIPKEKDGESTSGNNN